MFGHEITCDGAVFNPIQGYLKLTHGYVTFFMCLMGLISNIINIYVFSRKTMNSPTYKVLFGIAIADVAMLLEYTVYNYFVFMPLRFNNENGNVEKILSKNSISIRKFHIDFWQVFHLISVLLTCLLAFWRYLAVAYPTHYKQWCNKKMTSVILTIIYVSSPIICVPMYFVTRGTPTNPQTLDLDNSNSTPKIYPVIVSSAKEMNILIQILFTLHVVFFQIITPFMILIFTTRLIREFQHRKKRNQQRKNQPAAENANFASNQRREIDRKTRMLVFVVLLFFIMEVPLGILNILSSIKDIQIKCFIYMRLSTEILAVINSSANFVLYFVMNAEFRRIVSGLVFHNRNGASNFTSVVQTETRM